jgi:hypothetical protein
MMKLIGKSPAQACWGACPLALAERFVASLKFWIRR